MTNWITYERRLWKDIKAKANELMQLNEELSFTDAWTQASEFLKKFMINEWRRAIEMECDYELLRKEIRIEKGLEEPENKIKNTFAIDLTFTDDTPDNTRLEVTKEVYSALECKEMELAFEQRGHNEETEGKGIHVHSIIQFQGSKTKQEIIKIASPILKKHKCKSNQLEIEKISTSEYLHNRRKYIRGVKKGVDKDGIEKSLKVQYDKIMRERLQLDDIYSYETLHDIPTIAVSKPSKTAIELDRPIVVTF